MLFFKKYKMYLHWEVLLDNILLKLKFTGWIKQMVKMHKFLSAQHSNNG